MSVDRLRFYWSAIIVIGFHILVFMGVMCYENEHRDIRPYCSYTQNHDSIVDYSIITLLDGYHIMLLEDEQCFKPLLWCYPKTILRCNMIGC